MKNLILCNYYITFGSQFGDCRMHDMLYTMLSLSVISVYTAIFRNALIMDNEGYLYDLISYWCINTRNVFKIECSNFQMMMFP